MAKNGVACITAVNGVIASSDWLLLWPLSGLPVIGELMAAIDQIKQLLFERYV